ncbi:MAG: hypothetical protein ACREDT_06230 [Methylocella sp.]
MKLRRWLEWLAFAVTAPIVLYVACAFLYVFGPRLINGCDIAYGNSATNGRGDVVEDQVRDCAIIGSAAVYRIGLTLAGTEGFTALVYYDQGPKSGEPVFHWLDDNHLNFDLGEVVWLTRRSASSAASRSAIPISAPSQASNR